MEFAHLPSFAAQRWQPFAYRPAALGQTPQPSLPAPAPAAAAGPPSKMSLLDIDGPLPSFATAVLACSATAILGYGFGTKKSRWSTVFWALSGITGFKALVDLSRLR